MHISTMTTEQAKDRIIAHRLSEIEGRKRSMTETERIGAVIGLRICRELNNADDFRKTIALRKKNLDKFYTKGFYFFGEKREIIEEYVSGTNAILWCFEMMKIVWGLTGIEKKTMDEYARIMGIEF